MRRRSRWLFSIFCSKIGLRNDKKIKAMNVDELIDNLRDENGYGKFIVLEMKERFDSLDDKDKMKIIDTLFATTKANQKWAEGKRKQMKGDK